MPLLTRTTRRDEIRDRARDVSEELAGRARTARDELSHRAREAGDVVSSRLDEADLEELTERARERADEAGDVARSALRTLGEALSALVRLLLRVVSIAPGVGSSVLGALSEGLQRLGEKSADLADVPSHTARERTRSRRRAALWFVGGFAAGTATGYAASEVLRSRAPQERVDVPHSPVSPAPPAAGRGAGSGAAAG